MLPPFFYYPLTGDLPSVPQAPTPTVFQNTIAPSTALPTVIIDNSMVPAQSQECNGNNDCPAGFDCEAKTYCPAGPCNSRINVSGCDCYVKKRCQQKTQPSNDLLSCRTDDDCTLYNTSNCCGWKPIAKNALNLVSNIPQVCDQECDRGTPKCSNNQCILSK